MKAQSLDSQENTVQFRSAASLITAAQKLQVIPTKDAQKLKKIAQTKTSNLQATLCKTYKTCKTCKNNKAKTIQAKTSKVKKDKTHQAKASQVKKRTNQAKTQ